MNTSPIEDHAFSLPNRPQTTIRRAASRYDSFCAQDDPEAIGQEEQKRGASVEKK
jgi:hypothetical protein